MLHPCNALNALNLQSTLWIIYIHQQLLLHLEVKANTTPLVIQPILKLKTEVK